MRDITSIVRAVVTAAQPSPVSMALAHAAAEDFHHAMRDAFSAQQDIEAGDGDGGPCDPHWNERYQDALGRAAVALQKMPIRWAAVLEAELPK